MQDLEFVEIDQSLKAKTSLRMNYEAHVEAIKKQTGALEEVRQRLGLSQRKICQLLMVDPSAWTRWTRSGEDAPPHIYRALQWYLALNEKIPGLTPHYFIGKDPEVLHQVALKRISESTAENERLKQEIEALKAHLNLKTERIEKKTENLSLDIRANRWGFMFIAASTTILAVAFYYFTLRS
jgi:transcriptional regulator with XRE-family HTH domain